jgi:tRNA G10  N-methylase Trm11
MIMTRRYKGKTNELFTHFMCNLARFSSGYAHRPWSALRVLDPLAGGGTTLFTALVLGADVAGVEKNAQAVQSTATFLKQYARQQGIACQAKPERLKKLGKRWWFTLGKNPRKQFVLAQGETAQAAGLIAGFKKPHLIVADLPYGIQHHGQLVALLTEALPVWAALLQPSGALVLAWESTRFPRADMLALVHSTAPLAALDKPPYNMLAHRVDRVIKQRDVLVARLIQESAKETPDE